MNTAGYKVYDTAYRARPKAQQALAQTKTREGRPRTFEETLETIKPLRKSFNGPPYHLTVPPGFRLFGAAVTLRQTAGTVPYTFLYFVVWVFTGGVSHVNIFTGAAADLRRSEHLTVLPYTHRNKDIRAHYDIFTGQG